MVALLEVLRQLCGADDTIIDIEQNLNVTKTTDWIIDIGPRGGAEGDQTVAADMPWQVAGNSTNHESRI